MRESISVEEAAEAARTATAIVASAPRLECPDITTTPSKPVAIPAAARALAHLTIVEYSLPNEITKSRSEINAKLTSQWHYILRQLVNAMYNARCITYHHNCVVCDDKHKEVEIEIFSDYIPTVLQWIWRQLLEQRFEPIGTVNLEVISMAVLTMEFIPMRMETLYQEAAGKGRYKIVTYLLFILNIMHQLHDVDRPMELKIFDEVVGILAKFTNDEVIDRYQGKLLYYFGLYDIETKTKYQPYTCLLLNSPPSE